MVSCLQKVKDLTFRRSIKQHDMPYAYSLLGVSPKMRAGAGSLPNSKCKHGTVPCLFPSLLRGHVTSVGTSKTKHDLVSKSVKGKLGLFPGIRPSSILCVPVLFLPLVATCCTN